LKNKSFAVTKIINIIKKNLKDCQIKSITESNDEKKTKKLKIISSWITFFHGVLRKNRTRVPRGFVLDAIGNRFRTQQKRQIRK